MRSFTQEQFGHITGLKDGDNVFKRCLDQGEVISSIRIERCGIDEDDDALVIEFQRDAAAAPLRLRNVPSDNTD